jgi:hypothetical protein
VAGQAVPAGQWVYTQQYGWVWMPYGDAYSYVPPDGQGQPYEYVVYSPVVLYSSDIGLSTPSGAMSRLYWATSREHALAKHAADTDNLIFELTHVHSEGDLPDVPHPVRTRPRVVH